MDRAWPLWAGHPSTLPSSTTHLGLSGQSAEGRLGFQRLLAEVALDHVGIIFGLEMSRLARSCKGLASTPGTVRCPASARSWPDGDGLYDPTDYNDRLLLGLKGMMSEAELHILKERMYQGRLNKARRGEFVGLPPIGYIAAAQRWWPDHRSGRAGASGGAAALRPVRPPGHGAWPAALPGASPRFRSQPGTSEPRTQPGTTGVASALTRDPAEPAAPPDLREGPTAWLSSHRPPPSAARDVPAQAGVSAVPRNAWC